MAVVADGLQVVVAGSDDWRGVLIEFQLHAIILDTQHERAPVAGGYGYAICLQLWRLLKENADKRQ